MKLKCDDNVGKKFIFSEFSSKGLIKLNVNFYRFLDEILALLCNPMKPRFFYEIIALMHVKSVESYFYFIKIIRCLFFLFSKKLYIISAYVVVVYPYICFMNQLKNFVTIRRVLFK